MPSRTTSCDFREIDSSHIFGSNSTHNYWYCATNSTTFSSRFQRSLRPDRRSSRGINTRFCLESLFRQYSRVARSARINDIFPSPIKLRVYPRPATMRLRLRNCHFIVSSLRRRRRSRYRVLFLLYFFRGAAGGDAAHK